MSELSEEQREERRLARKAARQQRKRDVIADEASKLLNEDRYDFAVQELADRLDISQASVFYYFPGGKDELLTEVAWDDFRRYSDEITEACEAAEDGLAALEALVRTRFDQFFDDPEHYTFVHETVLKVPLTETPRADEFYELVNRTFDVVARKLTEGQEAGLVRDDIEPRVRVHSANMQASGLFMIESLRMRSAGETKHSTKRICDDLCRQLRESTSA